MKVIRLTYAQFHYSNLMSVVVYESELRSTFEWAVGTGLVSVTPCVGSRIASLVGANFHISKSSISIRRIARSEDESIEGGLQNPITTQPRSGAST
jgi:hypothetical protein